jgi:hypothetical protein
MTALNQTYGTYPERWHFDEGMREISGFGGGYEAACRSMLLAGGTWADAHPEVELALFTRVRDFPAELEAVMIAAAEPGGATGAMYGTVGSHIVHIFRMGWKAWVDQMRNELRQELGGGTELKRA